MSIISKKRAIWVTFIILALIGIGIYIRPKKVDQKDQRKLLLSKINSIWLNDEDNPIDKTCVDDNVSSDFYECNINFLNCSIKNLVLSGFELRHINKNYVFGDKSKNYLRVFDKRVKRDFKVYIKDTCHLASLPERVYSYGSYRDSSLIWDTITETVNIDKFYVTNYDISQWRSKTNIKLKKPLIGIEADYARTLRPLEMKKYCHYRGAEILKARYFDAATFTPSKTTFDYVEKFPYSWTKKRKISSNLTKSSCYHIYRSDCEKLMPLKKYQALSTSWMGIHFAHSLETEYMENNFDPDSVLRLSSKINNINEKYKQLGVRAKWQGEFAVLVGNKKIKLDEGVVFRCMSRN